MADVRRGKQKRKQRNKDEREKPSKEEYAVGKFLRFNESLNKDGKFLGNNSHYFIGSKAIDLLLESKWAAKSGKKEPLFTTRSSCEFFMERLLEKGFFFRVQKLEKRDKKKRVKEGSEKKVAKEETPSSRRSEKKSRKEKEEIEQDKDKEKEKDIEGKDGKDKEAKKDEIKSDKQKEEAASEERKRRKKRAKLEMHDMQVFIDGQELYVWMYDPVPAKTFIIGLLLVLGAIGVCLFPLWPPEVRLGVYYLSIAAACFVGLIIGLCVVRVILFGIIWAVTFGKISFWLLPNLTEDVGFVESFRPLYKYDVNNKTATSADSPQKSEGNDDDPTEVDKSKAEDNKSDNEQENVAAITTDVENDNPDEDINEDDGDVGDLRTVEDEEDNEEVDEDDDEGRKSGSSSNDNGYEIVDADDVENVGTVKEEIAEETIKDAVVRQRKGKKPARKES